MKGLIQILVVAFSLLGTCNLFGQDNSNRIAINRNSVFIEFGGNAPFISLNYDCLIRTKKENLKYALTVGATHHFNDIFDILVAPQFNVLIGRNLMAEAGTGVTIPISYIEDWVYILRFGGRYQKIGGGMMYRLAFTPLISPHNEMIFFPMFGVSIGYTFKCNKKK